MKYVEKLKKYLEGLRDARISREHLASMTNRELGTAMTQVEDCADEFLEALSDKDAEGVNEVAVSCEVESYRIAYRGDPWNALLGLSRQMNHLCEHLQSLEAKMAQRTPRYVLSATRLAEAHMQTKGYNQYIHVNGMPTILEQGEVDDVHALVLTHVLHQGAPVCEFTKLSPEHWVNATYCQPEHVDTMIRERAALCLECAGKTRRD